MEKGFRDAQKRWPTRNLAQDAVHELWLEMIFEHGYFESSIIWYDIGAKKPAAKLEMFEDQWKYVAQTGIIETLAAVNTDYPSLEEIKQVLLEHGWEDWTEKDR